jgi:hypothetical protein
MMSLTHRYPCKRPWMILIVQDGVARGGRGSCS